MSLSDLPDHFTKCFEALNQTATLQIYKKVSQNLQTIELVNSISTGKHISDRKWLVKQIY